MSLKLTNEVAKDIQFIRAEIERQKKCELDKEADSESSSSDIQSLRAELDSQKNEKESAIQSLRAEMQVLREDLEKQKKSVIDKEADNQSLRADLEKQNKDDLQKDSHIQSLRGEVERLGKLVEELVKETDKHHNCTEAKFSGIHEVLVPKFSSEPFKVACDAQTHNGGWTIILRRMDGSVNFYRNWMHYKYGFGNLDGEFFLGLDKIHAMTAERRQELLVLLEDFEGEQRYETYDKFAIGNENQQYELHTLGEANGTAGDSLDYHRGMKFSTFDKDNDKWEGVNCAIRYTGAWWYNDCQHSQLTGTYRNNNYDKGVNWYRFRGPEYSLKTAIMMIRPKKVGQEKLTNEVAKDSDIQFIRAEIERQKKCELDKEADSESSRADIQVVRADIQSLRAELDSQKNEKESAIQSLRAEIQVLRQDLEKQNKDVLQKESHIQSLRGEVERLGKLVDKLVKETDKHHNCTEAKISGIHEILIPKFSNQTFKVACDAETRGGGWTIILRRMDGSVNFYRNWTEYKNGFGNLGGEYFLGLDKIHAMTAERRQELLILLEDFEGNERYETYDKFAIGNENQQYELHTLGNANGTAGDSLDYHRGMKFTTFDKDNDKREVVNCAIRDTGAWWYGSCQFSQLTGTYKDNRFNKGVNWLHFRGPEYSLKTAIMMIRPKK
ncbi:hypothetical protein ACLKA7_004762 [Drosophila subpalustris]